MYVYIYASLHIACMHGEGIYADRVRARARSGIDEHTDRSCSPQSLIQFWAVQMNVSPLHWKDTVNGVPPTLARASAKA